MSESAIRTREERLLRRAVRREHVDKCRERVARQLSAWLRACDSRHGHDCQPRLMSDRMPHQTPEWIVDTVDGCIVPGRMVARYAALSYFWPKDMPGVPRLMLTRTNVETLQNCGSLAAELHRLPLVVRQAIDFVQKMGERYLWIDCLCIVQHDLDTQRQIDTMGEVYSGAYFTMVAAASSGLLHVPQDQDMYSGNEHSFKQDNMREEDHYEALLNSKWAKRGWTFQEQVLSKRMVVFLDAHTVLPLASDKSRAYQHMRVFWDCQHSLWDIDTPMSPLDNQVVSSEGPSRSRLAQSEAVKRPEYRSYLELVCLYSGRDFTYPQDVLVAFNGVLQRLEHAFPGGYASGIPKSYVDEILVWQPHTKAVRRLNVLKDGVAPSRYMPSWSWCGWKGLIDPNSLSAGLYHASNHASEVRRPKFRTISTVAWTVLLEQPMPEYSVLETGLFDANALSSTTRVVPDSNAMGAERTSQFHNSTPNETSEVETAGPVDWPYISCVTHRAYFRARALLSCRALASHRTRYSFAQEPQVLEPPHLPKTSVFHMPHLSHTPVLMKACVVLALEDDQGHWAGVLRVMDDLIVPPCGNIELVAISQGEVSHRDLVSAVLEESIDYLGSFEYPGYGGKLHYRPTFCESISRESPDELRPRDLVDSFHLRATGADLAEISGTYQYYNVLWIEQKEGIAYRQAAGRVRKESWEQHCSEPVRIVLG